MKSIIKKMLTKKIQVMSLTKKSLSLQFNDLNERFKDLQDYVEESAEFSYRISCQIASSHRAMVTTLYHVV